MADFYKGNIPIIEDHPRFEALTNPKGVSFGCVPRNMDEFPLEMFSAQDSMEVYKETDWDGLFDEQEAKQDSLEHIYLSGPNGGPRFVNLDQEQNGYCWQYSKGHCMMISRLANNLPVVRLNPCANAAILKKGKNQGGWCGEGVDLLGSMGMPDENHWPGTSRDLRHDTTEMRANAKKYRLLDDWFDTTRPISGQKMTGRQIATCGFNNVPTAQDFNWWGHSVCGIRWVRIEKGSWGPLILNSWLNWGRHGLGVLRGSKAVCDNAIGIKSTTPSST